jgi:hypothetical protein
MSDNLKEQIENFIFHETPADVVFARVESPYWDGVECHFAGDVLRIWNSENSDLRFNEDTNDYEPFEEFVLRELERRQNLLAETINFLKAGMV